MAKNATGAATAPAAAPIVAVTLTLGKTTKSTHVYNGPAQLPTVYIPKLDFPNPEQPPQQLKITIASA